MLAEGAVQAFHRAVVPGFAARGALLLLTLAIDGTRVAVYYGLRERETVYSYLQGFDPAWSAFSPGAMVVGEALEEAVRAGARRFDVLRGREEYKYRWGARDLPVLRRELRPAP